MSSAPVVRSYDFMVQYIEDCTERSAIVLVSMNFVRVQQHLQLFAVAHMINITVHIHLVCQFQIKIEAALGQQIIKTVYRNKIPKCIAWLLADLLCTRDCGS